MKQNALRTIRGAECQWMKEGGELELKLMDDQMRTKTDGGSVQRRWKQDRVKVD